jgi:hypothetical protein
MFVSATVVISGCQERPNASSQGNGSRFFALQSLIAPESTRVLN